MLLVGCESIPDYNLAILYSRKKKWYKEGALADDMIEKQVNLGRGDNVALV